jgi:hypothetical protein
MITIRYKSVVINGLDRSNKVETLPDAEALQLVKMGYAEIVRENASVRPPEIREVEPEVKDEVQPVVENRDEAPKKRVKKWG